MTVAELIAVLQRCPQDATVRTHATNHTNSQERFGILTVSPFRAYDSPHAVLIGDHSDAPLPSYSGGGANQDTTGPAYNADEIAARFGRGYRSGWTAALTTPEAG